MTRADRVTLYTSKTDLALIASKYFNLGPRAGDSGSDSGASARHSDD